MATIQDINDLNLKIAKAKTERDTLYNSLYNNNQPGGSWINAVQNECGGAFDPAKTDKQYPKQTAACTYVVNLVKTRLATIAKDDADILLWQNQVDALMKDPTIAQQIKDQELKRRITIGVVVILIAAAITGVAIWAYKKYKK